MKTAKLVLGIISIVLCLFVLLQSCVAGAANTILDTDESSGTGGLFLALFMLAGGVVSIAGRKNKSCAIACTVLYLIAGVIGFTTAGTVFKDLYVWAFFCCALAIVHGISIALQNYDHPHNETDYGEYNNNIDIRDEQTNIISNADDKRIKIFLFISIIVLVFTFIYVISYSFENASPKSGDNKPKTKTETTTPKITTTSVPDAPEYIDEFMLTAGEQGEYGKFITYNVGTEFEESFYAYYVPAGEYSVTNKTGFSTQFNVYSNETQTTENGWEEPVTVFSESFGVAETITVIIRENQHIEITEPSEFRMRLVSTDIPETTAAPEATPAPIVTEPPIITTITETSTTPAPEVPTEPYFQPQTAYIGNFVVTLTNATLYTNTEGNHILVADYQFTNNSQETESMAWSIIDTAFQNGIELDQAYEFDLPDGADYDSSNQFRDIKNGATLDVQVAYSLIDNINPIEIELNQFFDLSGAAPQVFTIALS